MNKKVIFTDKAPSAIGPYSQAIRVGDFIFTSGQIALNPSTGEIVYGDIKKATAQCIENIKAIAEAEGCSLDDVVKTTVFLKDINQFTEMNEIYGTYFKTNQPARSAVQVAKLPKDVDVEIEAVILAK